MNDIFNDQFPNSHFVPRSELMATQARLKLAVERVRQAEELLREAQRAISPFIFNDVIHETIDAFLAASEPRQGEE